MDGSTTNGTGKRSLTRAEETLLSDFIRFLFNNRQPRLCVLDEYGDGLEDVYRETQLLSDEEPGPILQQFCGLSNEEWEARERRFQLDALRENPAVPSWAIEILDAFVDEYKEDGKNG